jgi:SeqA protein C-terminal domain
MQNLELSEETRAALERLAAAKNTTPAELIAAMVNAGRPPLGGDNLLFFLASREMTAVTDPDERYLALLAWVAKHYACDFADFISHQDSAARYLGLNRDEVTAQRERNHARQIDGTQWWAVMNIDESTRARFVRRMLEFIGCHEETVLAACRALNLPLPAQQTFRLLGVA